MNEGHSHNTSAISGGAPFDGPVAHVSDGKEPGHVGLITLV
jgi:hypothetical protein